MRQLSWEADEYVLGRVDSSQLPMIAAQALARGIDSPALCELAGLGRAEVREAGDLFAIAMAELGQTSKCCASTGTKAQPGAPAPPKPPNRHASDCST
jgi:hypothetical protein